MSADKCNICDLNEPLEDALSMKANFQYRADLFSQNTQKDRIKVLLEYCSQNGFFSNMDTKEREQFKRFQEKIA